jgi:hypothetical protein
VDLDRRVRNGQLLDVRVDADELDVRDPRVDHPVDRVQPRTADSDDTDDREVGAWLRARRTMEAGRRLRECLDPRKLLDGPQVRPGCRLRLRLAHGLGLVLGWRIDHRLERRRVLDGLLERLDRSRVRLALGLLLLSLPLRGLGRPEELGERAFTHAGALSRH